MKAMRFVGVSTASLVVALHASAAGAQTAPATAGEPAGSVAQVSEKAKAGEPQADDATAASENEITVTGSRLATGFRAPTPVTVVGQDQLALRGATAVTEALSEIPAFRNTNGASQGTGGSFMVGQGLLDLRGLGAIRTLVLVDGRRHVPTNANGTWDTNQLPSGLVLRTDVVTGGASAAYGSDAVAGVVNFVIDEKLEGIRAGVQAGLSQRKDAGQQLVSLAYGTAFAGNRGHFVIGGDYSTGDPSGTMYSRAWGRREESLVALPANRAAGLPAQLFTAGSHLSISPGSLVVSCVRAGVTLTGAACPIGNLTFDNNGQPRPFVFGDPRGALQMAGGENYGFNQFHDQLLRVGTQRWSALARGSFDLNDSISAWAELASGRFEVETKSSDYINTGSIIIQRSNPFLPAALATQMDAQGITQFNLARVNFAKQRGTSANNVNRFVEGAIGLKGTFGGDWKWDAHYTKGQSKFEYRIRGLTVLPNYLAALYVVRDANGNPVCGPIATNPMFQALQPGQRAAFTALVQSGCIPFNPFGPEAESDAALEYVAPTGTRSLTTFDRQSAAVNIAGSPFNTWAGPFSLAVGGEWRKDKAVVTLNAVDAARSAASAFFAANPQPGSGGLNVKEVFGEIGVPLAKDVTLLRSLDLNGAVRYTDYSTSGTVTTWKAGATWEPFDGLRLRYTRSRDIRAANIPELFYRGNDGFAVVSNPTTGRGNQINSAALNNPNLRPEKADTWTAGVVLEPQWSFSRGLQLSVDYYSIRVQDVIASIPTANIIAGYYLQGRTDYAPYFTFDPQAPSGFTRVDSPLLNLNQQRVRGLDVNLSYTLPVPVPGKVRLTTVASRLYQLETFDATGASLGNIAKALPAWRATGNLTYSLDGFATTLTGRYNSPMKYNILLVGPDSPDYNPAAANSISKNTFPAAMYFSLETEYTFRSEGRGRLTVYALVDNLLDKDPPAGAFTLIQGIGSQPSQSYSPYDTLGRYFKIGARIAL